jgi:hypothetical protein
MILLEATLHNAIEPALAMLPVRMSSSAARANMLAIGLQESRLIHRFQKIGHDPYAKGPARGLWQFERGGGVFGVMTHRATKDLAVFVCAERKVPFDSSLIHARLEFDDVLAAAFARLLLYTHPKALPGEAATYEESWQYYLSLWRPGKPHRATWNEFHDQAWDQVYTH